MNQPFECGTCRRRDVFLCATWREAQEQAELAGWRYRTSSRSGLWYCPEHSGAEQPNDAPFRRGDHVMRRTHKPRGHGVRSTRPPVGVVEHIWSTRDWNRKRQSWEIRWHCKVRWLRSFAHFSAGWIDTRSTILAASLRLATIDEVQVATR